MHNGIHGKAAMAIRKREIEKTSLILTPSPYRYKGSTNLKLDAIGERNVRLLHAHLAANFSEIWEFGEYAPAYAIAKFLGMHRIAYMQWSYAMFKLGLFDLGPSLPSTTPSYEPDHPSYRPDTFKTVAMYRPKPLADVDGEPVSVAPEVTPYDPFNPDDAKYDRDFNSALGAKDALRYVDRYYLSTVDEYFAVRGKHRKYKDGRFFAPVTILSEGIEFKDRTYETENRKHELSEACRVATVEEAKNRVRPLLVPAHTGKLPVAIYRRLNPPLAIKKRPKK